MSGGQQLVFNCQPDQVFFLPGIGWTVRMTDEQILQQQVQTTIDRAEANNEMVSVKINIPNSPVPMGQPISIQSSDGKQTFKHIAEQVSTDPAKVRAAMQARNPSEAEPEGSALAHRRGQGKTDVFGRILQATASDPNAPGEGHLIDALVTSPHTFIPAMPQSAKQAITDAIKVARGYIVDRSASYRIGQLCVAAADMIADNQEFARLPYPVMWVELDQRAVLAGMKSRGAKVLDDSPEDGDDRLGFLYTGHGVYVAARNKGDDGRGHAGWSPFAYRMGRPLTNEQLRRWALFTGGNRDILDNFLWGNVYGSLTRRRGAALSEFTGLDVLLPEFLAERNPEPLRPMLAGGGAGDWKLALATLLVLLRPGVAEQQVTRMPQRKLTSKGMRKLIGLTTVTINISARSMKSSIRRGLEEARRGTTRWHEVRGHYMHNRVAREADCIHEWEELEPNKWTCRHCQGRRAWREYPNGRGSQEAGTIAKHYRVTSKGAAHHE